MVCNSDLFIFYDNEHILITNSNSYLKSKSLKVEDFLKYDLNDITSFLESQDNFKKVCPENKECVYNNIDRVYIGIIQTCNLHCYHCCAKFDNWSNDLPYYITLPHNREDNAPRKELFFKILDKFKNQNLTICFDGSGEIFLYYHDIVNWLKTLNENNKIQFLTNGTLLNEERIQKLKFISDETKVEYEFYLSVDGATKETFEFLRRGASFKETIKIIKLLQKYKFSVHIQATIKKYNIQEAYKMKSLFKRLRVTSYGFGYDWFEPSLADFVSNGLNNEG
jgi:MoaA/NifB/PqqE/SkfB family radical SAM enzyme